MKKGQAALDYILLIGVFAAALVAMLVYVNRGLQGGVRSNAEKLGAGQYDPGNTTIHNTEVKKIETTQSSGTNTTVNYGNMNEPNEALDNKLEELQTQQEDIDSFERGGFTEDELQEKNQGGYTDEEIEEMQTRFEGALAIEGDEEALKAFEETFAISGEGGQIDPATALTWAGPPEGGIVANYITELNSKYETLGQLSDEYDALKEDWDAREITEDSSSSTSYSSESGKTSTSKNINESLGGL
ncbi:MAG: hypothetical protein PHH57_04690 [Candidatus Omnitrophica bacterium]|nr:hypothetical protein [Candidatus Omnitrophota bacterium]